MITKNDIIYLVMGAILLLAFMNVVNEKIRPGIRKGKRATKRFFRKRYMSFKKHRRMKKVSRATRRQVRKLLNLFKLKNN
jgi:hypothetical protein